MEHMDRLMSQMAEDNIKFRQREAEREKDKCSRCGTRRDQVESPDGAGKNENSSNA